MTLTLDVSRSNFEIALSQELLVWLMWNEKEMSWYDTGPIVRPCPLTTPMTFTLESFYNNPHEYEHEKYLLI